jgi:WD40 repeat protein
MPTQDQMRKHFEWLREEYPDDPLSYGLSMEHGAISPDGKLIAAGHQSSLHYLFDADSLDVVAEIGYLSEYPHHAAFSRDGEVVAFNSCHFYNGMTIGVPTDLLPGLKTAPYELDHRLILLEEGSRVYASVSRDDEFIIGDASGYLRAFDLKGNFLWRHFIGSTVGDIDVDRDGKRLIVTTYAGFLSILDMDTGEPDPFAIGTATHRERRRWLFWKKESHPLIW